MFLRPEISKKCQEVATAYSTWRRAINPLPEDFWKPAAAVILSRRTPLAIYNHLNHSLIAVVTIATSAKLMTPLKYHSIHSQSTESIIRFKNTKVIVQGHHGQAIAAIAYFKNRYPGLHLYKEQNSKTHHRRTRFGVKKLTKTVFKEKLIGGVRWG